MRASARAKARHVGPRAGTVPQVTLRMVKIVGVAAGAAGILAAVVATGVGGGGDLDPAAGTVAELPTVTDFSLRAASDGCAFDQARGGLVYKGLTIASTSTGVLALSFYAQRGSLDDILPGYVSTVLTFDEDARSHTFDLVVPVTQAQYEAGYNECRFATSSS